MKSKHIALSIIVTAALAAVFAMLSIPPSTTSYNPLKPQPHQED